MESANLSTPKQSIPRWVLVAIALVALLAGVIWVYRPQSASTEPLEISVAEAAAKQEAGALVLDVREPGEWNEAHIEGATLIPLGQLSSRLNELPKDKEILVICSSGGRSAQGRDILLNAGFIQVTSIAGGLIKWMATGYPTVSGP